LKQNWQVSLLVLFIILMITPYCYLAITTDHKFYSPDETANFVFTKQFIENSTFSIETQINTEVNNAIFPRSVNVTDGNFVPMSFLGLLIFYGLAGKLFSIYIVTFLTPLLSLLGVFLFFKVIDSIFNKNTALFASLCLLFNPIYWYLAGKSMMHNNLFVFFIILGLWLLIKALSEDRFKTIFFSLSAIVFGVSIWTRTSEIIWVGILLLIFYIVNKKMIQGKYFFLFLSIFCIMIGALFAINYSIYSSLFRTGYSSLEGQANNSIIALFQQILLPFGFSLKNIGFHIWEFFIKYLWFLTLPGIWGIILFSKIKKTSLQKSYLLSTILISIYLLIYYGSYWPWGQYGQPSEPEVLIGSPHLRYWLPILVLSLPFIYIFIEKVLPKLFSYIKEKKVILVSLIIFFSILISFSTHQVFYSPKEGYVKIKNDIEDFSPRLEKVSELIEPDSIIIVPAWADRVFYPEYDVIHSLGDKLIYQNNIYDEVKKLAELRPVYYYSANSDQDITSLNNTEFIPRNLVLVEVLPIFKGEKLYKLSTYEQ
jgi:4-amino-4-deoxy-L-arabinose transferase-like glycosyltransferase